MIPRIVFPWGNKGVAEIYGYSAVDHLHDWHEHSNGDAFCPICALWRSQIEKARG